MLKPRSITLILHTAFYKKLCLGLLLLTNLTSVTYANTQTPLIAPTHQEIQFQKTTLIEQRKQFQQAEKAYKKKQFRLFNKLSTQLKNYPLYPYLEYKRLLRKPSKLTNTQIFDFLDANNGTVIGDRFRLKLIKHFSSTQNWSRLIDIYQSGFGTATECKYINALWQTQQTELAAAKTQEIWLSARSQPSSCNTLFTKWSNADKKTPELIWQRFKLAMSVNNRRLARYLIRSMPLKDTRIAQQWLKLHRKPTLVTSSKITKLKHPDQSLIVLHGLKRLISRDVDLAIKAYKELHDYPFSADQTAEVTRRIGLKLARKHMPDATAWLSRIPESHTNKHVKEWQIRTAIRQGDWLVVREKVASLSIEKQSAYRWQYWWAYANEQLGNVDDAQGIFQYLSSKRNYYGFLAADHINQPYKFEENPVETSAMLLADISLRDDAIRAHEFYLMDKILPARREWHRLIEKLDSEQKLMASKLAQSWGWHDRAIVTMGKTKYRDDIELRFPLHLDNKVYTWSNQHNIDPAWTYAIIRRESAFMYDARSTVGALGLMQLMPNTARYMARYLKIRYRGRHSLLKSDTNIRLGTGYLERMLTKLNSQQVLATAAYNAGPNRVKKWLPELVTMDAARWIETIPFTETREYVSNVLAYMAIYEHRMNKTVTRLSQRMPPIPAKNPLSIAHRKETTPKTPLNLIVSNSPLKQFIHKKH